eukprot:582-Rhodomonas_salina.1
MARSMSVREARPGNMRPRTRVSGADRTRFQVADRGLVRFERLEGHLAVDEHAHDHSPSESDGPAIVRDGRAIDWPRQRKP